MTKTPLLLVPGMLCSPRLFAAQVLQVASRRQHAGDKVEGVAHVAASMQQSRSAGDSSIAMQRSVACSCDGGL